MTAYTWCCLFNALHDVDKSIAEWSYWIWKYLLIEPLYYFLLLNYILILWSTSLLFLFCAMKHSTCYLVEYKACHYKLRKIYETISQFRISLAIFVHIVYANVWTSLKIFSVETCLCTFLIALPHDTGHEIIRIVMHLCQQRNSLSKAERVRFPLFMEAITWIGYFCCSGITPGDMG